MTLRTSHRTARNLPNRGRFRPGMKDPTQSWPQLSLPVAVLSLLLFTVANCEFCHAQSVRFGTFNVSMYGNQGDELKKLLEKTDDLKCACIAEIIQRAHPDILLLNEFDYDVHGESISLFQRHYLNRPQNVSGSEAGPATPIGFPFCFVVPSNTGIHSARDLDRNSKVTDQTGSTDYAADCWGYGRYPGQYAMVILSKYPIEVKGIRTFKSFKWKDMPGALLPDDPKTEAESDWYPPEVLQQFPLSSKNHVDVPIRIGERLIHVLASHPTPPVYDGPEDRNGRRNHDEIRFWVDYISGGPQADYIYDDEGVYGGLSARALFVIMGDLNGDPFDGEGSEGIRRLLESPRLAEIDPPQSEGGQEQSTLQGGANLTHRGDPSRDTLDAADDPGPGNLRLDYVLPAREMRCVASKVFWPNNDDRLFNLVGTHPFPGSDHRLVWVDVQWDELPDR